MYENIFHFNLVSYLHLRLMLRWGRCAQFHPSCTFTLRRFWTNDNCVLFGKELCLLSQGWKGPRTKTGLIPWDKCMRSSYGSRVVAFATLLVSSSPSTHALYSNLTPGPDSRQGSSKLAGFQYNMSFLSQNNLDKASRNEIDFWCKIPECSGALMQATSHSWY